MYCLGLYNMQKFILSLLFFSFPFILDSTRGEVSLFQPEVQNECYVLYTEMSLQNVVDYNAFEQAYTGYRKIGKAKKEILTIIDFSKPSTQKRFYVLDIKKKKLLYSSHVSHGKKSGDLYATSFSNAVGSNKSSLGFFITENTYKGRNGYSLVLNGLESGINDKARERAIVVHGADYSDPSLIEPGGRLGRSLGCPALPFEVSDEIIDVIKEGSVLYIYANDKSYMSRTSILSDQPQKLLTQK